MPLDYTESWSTAMDLVRTRIIADIGTAWTTRFGAALSPEKNFLHDYLMPKVWQLALFSGGGDNVQNNWHEANPTELVMNSSIQGRFATRADARAAVMLLLQAIPLYRTGNIEWFRIQGAPSIDAEVTRLANDKKDQLYWRMTIPCLLVFKTAEEYA